MLSADASLRPAATQYWIRSSPFDLSFYVLSPLVGLLVLLLTPWAPLLPPITTAALGAPHYAATFLFYLWDENQSRHRTRWVAFFAGPVIIVMLTALVFALKLTPLIAFATFFWNAFHVSRQSTGILSIYRQRAGVLDPRQRTLANRAILSANFCFATWNTVSYPALHKALSLPGPWFPGLLSWSLLMIATFSLLHLGTSLWRRRRVGPALHPPELAFLLTSVLLFHPYIWVADSNLATNAMLLGHFLQYLAIVWLLHRRKFRMPSGSSAQILLYRIVNDLRLFVLVCLGIGLLFAGTYGLFAMFSRPGYFEALFMMVAFTHFYLDGLFWAFRNPFVRKSIGPHLIGARVPATNVGEGSA